MDAKVEAVKEAVTKPEFPRDEGNGSGTCFGYYVEARYDNNGQSCIVNGIALGPKWTVLQFDPAPIGVPIRYKYDPLPKYSALMPYESAQALRWWWLANAHAHDAIFCVETRLVKVAREEKYTERAVAAVEVTTKEDRWP